jgi:hypothetical protein
VKHKRFVVKRGQLVILPRHAHSMGCRVACMLNDGKSVLVPDNPFPLASENHRAWHEGYSLTRNV